MVATAVFTGEIRLTPTTIPIITPIKLTIFIDENLPDLIIFSNE